MYVRQSEVVSEQSLGGLARRMKPLAIWTLEVSKYEQVYEGRLGTYLRTEMEKVTPVLHVYRLRWSSAAGPRTGCAGATNPFGDADAMIENGRFAFDPSFEWAGGGFMVNSAALARWAKLLYENRAFDPALNADFHNGVEARGLGAGARYGLGVIITETPLGTAYGHSGFFPGYLTEVRYRPEHRFAIAIQLNTSAGRPLAGGTGRALAELAGIVSAAIRGDTPRSP